LVKRTQRTINIQIDDGCNSMSEARKCKCTADEQTGTTEIECCNICGLPIKGERWSFDNQWQPMDTAPRDRLVLLDLGLIYPVVGVWNKREQKWISPDLPFPLSEKNDDPYFENIYTEEKPSEIKAWMPLPEVADAE